VSAVFEQYVSKTEAKRLDRILNPFEEASLYLEQHFDQLVSRFEDEWVALHKKKVVAHSRTFTGLKRKLPHSPYASSQLYVTFLTRKEQILIL
jgi:hypothetical protein